MLIPIDFVLDGYRKAANVVLSCETEKQFVVAMHYYKNLITRWDMKSSSVGCVIEEFLWETSAAVIRNKAAELGVTDFGPFNKDDKPIQQRLQ